ncbi:low specificity L-threonine aldolase [Mediterraneibacter glycyrrhizinilyticus]|uniref:threonine aldolase family protein n=1 Tax=Mediterraneibacter glycyrrhizinilyticus TaxID=342942 RepID=UPI00195FA986|nr:aminotransferase class V-fold PLP-dependent enzyme [Mediterraneibacter glycyrrhizinilyticus]MBM6749930.1 low specificity L-threonine aldolase [Mediterraneibacter glycyrrhizinilyticus]
MISFENDYIQGAHPEILRRLAETNMEPLSGYGSDPYCESAREKIRKACGCENAEVYFLVGGTQTNAVVIDAMTKGYEGVVAADSGHIAIHEAGAVEFTGHKVLTVLGQNGKIDGKELRKYLQGFYQDENHEHMVFPGMVYLSHPTEFGTLYTKEELSQISEVCREYEIPLYLDGARLGYGLMSRGTDVSLSDVAEFCDAFYIGGTKVGALCGEAVVFPGKAPKHFLTVVKQHGALLAKGRLPGIQFDTLFTDDLYFRISSHAIEMAEKLKEVLREKGLPFAWESPTNQQFVVMEDEKMEQLRENVVFSFWEKADRDHTIVRFATSWGTKEEEIEELKRML